MAMEYEDAMKPTKEELKGLEEWEEIKYWKDSNSVRR